MAMEPLSTDFSSLVQALSAAHQQLQAQAARSVDTALVLRNWLFGWHLTEFENARTRRRGGRRCTARTWWTSCQLP